MTATTTAATPMMVQFLEIKEAHKGPYDEATAMRPGSRQAPRAIRDASALQSPDAPYGWGYNVMEEFATVTFDEQDLIQDKGQTTQHVYA